MYVCPKCNTLVQRPAWSKNTESGYELGKGLPRCSSGHKLRDNGLGLHFITGGVARAFLIGALYVYLISFTCGLFIEMIRPNSSGMGTTLGIWEMGGIILWIGAIWWSSQLAFRTARRLKAIGKPTDTVAGRFNAAGYGVLGSAASVAAYGMFTAIVKR